MYIFLVLLLTIASNLVQCNTKNECPNPNGRSASQLEENCKWDSTSVVCSGRGICVCGYCECDQRPYPDEVFSGKFCECDNFSCDRYNGMICGGPEHGICECGVCHCRLGWSGSDCSTNIQKQ